ncbi:sensor histidine kinase [Falsarthrobacter nasiphocae]|uniref:Sensor-like histidine kinase SenX3 n=1 Tax=Falsarthrobacter nasiphocae TaxID=189863 RepID=A0AAE3YDC4_9MICC|nr:ATP-binding protein [Falsarthrobacter nasiphocae]MDR6891768.1 two-component system sensor histidine kinase SenX3 [Falsarthrobacter nasiphocae]
MNPAVLAIVSVLAGVLVGAGGVYAFMVSERKRGHVDEPVPTIGDGAAEVLSVVGRGYVVVDSTNGVVKANPSAYAYGLIRGHSLVHEELRSIADRVRRDGVVEEAQFELPRTPLGGASIVVFVRAAALGDEFILLLADDRTEVTRTEAVRNDFVANVSHELKTPVGAISLLSEAIDDAADDEEAVRRFAKRLFIEAKRLSALVQDIIELSRLQGTNVVIKGQRVSIDAVISEAIDRNTMSAEAKSITIRAGRPLGAYVHADAEQITMGLRNLIDNAIRYSPAGTTVGVGARLVDGVVTVSVTDQGPGISPEDQERIFERFYRVDAARSRQTGGTGLGLSIVKHVFTNHGGDVTVWSHEGQGSTFTVRLPQMDESAVADENEREMP